MWSNIDEKSANPVSLYEYCKAIDWANDRACLPDYTLVKYISHKTGKFVQVKTLNHFVAYRHISVAHYKRYSQDSDDEFIPEHQIKQLRAYLTYFSCNKCIDSCEEECRELEAEFQTREQCLEGLNEVQRETALRLLGEGVPLPAVLSDKEMAAITSFEDMLGHHIWGLQFRSLMVQLKLTAVKLLNETRLHNTVKMEENVEIVDPARFVAHSNCIGGIHATTSEHFHQWLNYNGQIMRYYAEVEVLDHSQVEVGDNWKFKTDRLVLRNVRLISELPQWSDPDYVFQACVGPRSKCAAAAAASPNVPIEYKLRALHLYPDDFISNVKDLNLEPVVVQKLAVQHQPRLMLSLVNPSVELMIDAIRAKPELILKRDYQNSVVYGIACEFGVHTDVIGQIPAHMLTEATIRLYLGTSAFDFLSDEIPVNVVTAALALPVSFYNWMMKENPGALFRLVQFMENRDALLAQFVSVVAEFPKLMNHVIKQPAEFQWAVLRETKQPVVVSYLDSPTPEMCQFALDSMPGSLPFLPQPWSNAAIVKHAVFESASILDNITSMSHSLMLELIKASKGKESIAKKVYKQINWLDQKFVEQLICADPTFIESFPKNQAEQYQLIAVNAAISQNSLNEFFIKLGGNWYWKAETWRIMLQAIPSLMRYLPKYQGQFGPQFDDLICEQIKVNPQFFVQLHQFFNATVIARCLVHDASHIRNVFNPTEEQQFIAVAQNPLNIQYIVRPADAVVAWAVKGNEAAFGLVQNFSNQGLADQLGSMIKKRKDAESDTGGHDEAKSART